MITQSLINEEKQETSLGAASSFIPLVSHYSLRGVRAGPLPCLLQRDAPGIIPTHRCPKIAEFSCMEKELNFADQYSIEMKQLKKLKTKKCSVKIHLRISFSGQQIHYKVTITDKGMVASLDIYINEFLIILRAHCSRFSCLFVFTEFSKSNYRV